MAEEFKYKVTIPGYKDSFLVRSPTELNQQQAYEYARKQADSLVSATPRKEISPLYGIASEVSRGATFGFADELAAAAASGQLFSGNQYERIKRELQGEQEQFRQESPATSVVSNLVGAVGGPLSAFKLLPKSTQVALSPTTLPKQVATGVATGAAGGALTGAGEAPTMQDIPFYSGISGTAGAVGGAVAPVVIQGGGTLIRNALNAAGVGDVEKISNRMIADALRRENITSAEASQVLDQLRANGVPNVVLADIGQNLRDLAYRAYVVPSGQKAATSNFLESRMMDQPNDIVKGLVQNAGLGKNVSGYEYLNFLAENQKSAASAKYPLAYSKAIDTRDFRKYVDRPVFQDAYKEAQKRAGVYGDTLPDLEQIRNSQFVPTNVLHQIKIGLDRIVDAETDKITGKVTGYGNDVKNVRKEFNDLIKDKNEFYKKANQEFADNERISSAFETGQKYQKLEYKEAFDKLKKMNDSEKEAFRLGMMADVNSRLENFKSGDFTRQIFKSDKQKSLLRYAFTDPKQYDNFVNYVDGLKQQSLTGKRIIGTVPTAENMATIGSDQAADLLTSAASGKTALVSNLLKQVAPRARGIGEQSSAELQKKLFSVDPIEQRAILTELRKRTQPQPNYVLPTGVSVGNITGLLGNQ
jgi:hypothetical protein